MGRLLEYTMGKLLSKNEMDRLENMLENFLSKNDIKLTIPVDVFKMATKLGFNIRSVTFRNTSLEGLLLVDETVPAIDGFHHNKIIAFDSNKKFVEQNFIVAHEFAHYIEFKETNPNDKAKVAARDHDSEQKTQKEQEIDYLAAALLVPKKSLQLFIKYNVTDVEELSNLYKVSPETITRRIKEVST